MIYFFIILNGANLSPSGVKSYVQIPICIGYGIASIIALLYKKAISKKEILGLMVKQPHIEPRELEKLKMPTLVIVGRKDMIKDKHSALIAASIPNSKLVQINGDHFIAAKNSNEFNKEVSCFLND